VRTSAPGGSDSKRSDCICGPDGWEDIHSGIAPEHPPSAMPITAAAAATMSLTRDMTLSVPKLNLGPRRTPVNPVNANRRLPWGLEGQIRAVAARHGTPIRPQNSNSYSVLCGGFVFARVCSTKGALL